MSKLLPEIQTGAEFSELFQQDLIWRPALEHLVKELNLQGPIRRANRGSHIVYRIGDQWLKLMAPIYSKDMAYELEGLKSTQGRLSVKTPEIRHIGELESWPYVVMSDVPGVRIGDVYSELNQQNQISLATEIARITTEISEIRPSAEIKQRADWNVFIQQQYMNVYEHHKARKMEEPWLAGLKEFISKFDVKDFMTSRPKFLHSDLTFDHFLLSQTNGQYKVSAVIDFADCRCGHPEYEMPASAIFIFKGNAPALTAYVQTMNLESLAGSPSISEKLMAWTLLHQFSNLAAYFDKEMKMIQPGNFSELSKLVFPV